MTEVSKRFHDEGGEHTRRKLDVVAKYLAEYAAVIKKQELDESATAK